MSFFSFLCLFWSTLSLFCSGWPRTHPCSASASASWTLILWHGGVDNHAWQFIYYKCMGMFEPRSRLYSPELPQEEEHEVFEISPWRGCEGPKTTQAIPTAVGCPPELDAKACCWRHHMLWAQNTGKSFGTGLEASSLLVGPRRPKRCCVGCGRELLPNSLTHHGPCVLQINWSSWLGGQRPEWGSYCSSFAKWTLCAYQIAF